MRSFTLPALATSTLGVVSKLWVDGLDGRFGWGAMGNLGQHPEQGGRHHDRTGVPQRRTGLPLRVDLRRALGAQRHVMGGAQVCTHPQLTVDECRDGLGGQMLSGAESAWADRLIALRGELSR
jgi:hypothetical protein